LSRIIAIANQKGGVGKTTTAVNLGACLAAAEKRTLIIDIDPQGNATSGVGIAKEDVRHSVYDVLVDGLPLADAVVPAVHFPCLDVVPATRDLVGVEVELVDRAARESVLRRATEAVRDRYEFILIDAPPSLGLLTLNTLTAADAVLIPIQCEFYALEGLSQLLNTVRIVQRNLNPRLQIDGVLLTMYDQRLNLSKQVAEEAKEYFGGKVYDTVIPRNVRIAEAPSFGTPIILYDILSLGAKSYLSLAREVIARGEGRVSAGEAETIPALAGGVEE
jgi:chromosome partitioning protein